VGAVPSGAFGVIVEENVSVAPHSAGGSGNPEITVP